METISETIRKGFDVLYFLEKLQAKFWHKTK